MGESKQENDALAIFNAALQIASVREQVEYVANACADDQDLRKEVQALLKSKHEAGSLLADSSIDTNMTTHREELLRPKNNHRAEKLPSNIGPYKIREKIGEGGMGVVYVAEQTEPVQRKVALKVIKPGMDTREVIARFEGERQALAFMEHPNIARVLDAGATDTGRSYFVMELVRGIPITEYCDQVKARPKDRLELFQTVCDAVQHAHQKGIIHRDLKPSNVLVTQVSAKPVVKVIDFGLAKATSGQKLTDKTVYTAFMGMMGTPMYMSPEQAGLSGQDVDTRSDVYSLGVLLYELLTGTTPLDKTEVQRKAYDDLFRQIREVEAPKPSARISTLKNADRSTIAQQRRIEPSSLRQLLSGDLDRVVMKALEKDRDQRYETPKHLANDIDRFLNDHPVLAVPPSPVYLARKYFRRHRAAILTGAAIALSLILATAFSTRQAIVATRATKQSAIDKQEADVARTAAEASAAEAQKAKDAAIVEKLEKEQLATDRKRLLYTSDMRAAAQLWDSPNGDLRKIEELLTAWIPVDDTQEDLRDFTWRLQWTRLHKSAAITVLDATGAGVSESGKLLTADKNGIREWDDQSLGSPRWKGDASHVIFSPNGRWAVVTNGDVIKPSCTLIEIASGKEVLEAPYRLCGFSPTSNFLYAWTHDGVKIDIWDVSSGKAESLDPIDVGEDHILPNDSRKLLLSGDGRSFLERGKPNYSSSSVFLDGVADPIELWNRNSNQSAVWSPDSRMAVIGSFTGIAQVRLRSDLFRNKWMIGTNCDGVGVARFSPDGKTLATAGGNGKIDLWDVSALHELAQLAGPNAISSRLAESHDSDGTSQEDNLAPKLKRTIKADLNGIRSIEFSSDGTKLASLGKSGAAKFWDLDRTEGRYEIANMAENLLDGRIGVNLEDSEQGIVIKKVQSALHEIVSGKVEVGDRLVSLTEESTGETFDCSNRDWIETIRLTVGKADSLLRLTLTSNGEDRKNVVLRRKEIPPRSFRSAFSQDSKTVVVGDMFVGTVSLDSTTGVATRYPTMGISVGFSPRDNDRLLAVGEWSHVTLWDRKRNEIFDRLPFFTDEERKTLPNSNDAGGTIAFSPDGNYLAVGTGYTYGHGNFSKLKVWRLDSGGCEEIQGPKIEQPLFRQKQRLGAVLFSPDSSRLIVGDSAGKVRIWKTSDWSLERTFEAGARVWGLAITRTADEKLILATGGGGAAVLWDFESGEKLRVLPMPEPMTLAFSPDGKTLASGSRNHLVTLWDVESGSSLRSFYTHTDAVKGVKFAPDGNTLATVGSEGVLRLWQASTFEEIESYPPTRESLFRLGQLRNREDRFEEAEAILYRLLEIQQAQLDTGHSEIKRTKLEIAQALRRQGKLPTIIQQPESLAAKLGEVVQLTAEISEGPWSLQWYCNNQPIAGATSAQLKVNFDSETNVGVYYLEASVEDRENVLPVRTDMAYLTQTGDENHGIRWEVYNDIPRRFVMDLTKSEKYPDKPDESEILENFETARDTGNNYGGRATGYLLPPITGDYVFYLTSDYEAQLFLSDTESPDDERMIARAYWTNSRQWKSAAPGRLGVSEPIHLERGKRYSIRALLKEGVNTDHLAVTWQMPGQAPPNDGDPPIPGAFLRYRSE